MKNRRDNRSQTEEEIAKLTELKNEATTFLTYQKTNLAATRIQTVWRRYFAMKKYAKAKQIYVFGRNSRVHDMITREIDYTKLITQLAQRYAVPLVNSTDKVLKEEGHDIFEILRAIIDIEKLHRYIHIFFNFLLTYLKNEF